MIRTAKSLLPSLLMLYLPILLVGGLGLSQMRGIEAQLIEVSRLADPVLDGASRELELEVDNLLLRSLGDLGQDRPTDEVVRRLEALSQPGTAIESSFLLPYALSAFSRPIWPDSGRGRLAFRGDDPLTAGVPEQVQRRVRDADRAGGLLGAEAAAALLAEVREGELDAPEAEAWLRLNQGAWLLKAGRPAEAATTLRLGREALEFSLSTDHRCYIDLLLQEARALAAAADAVPDPDGHEVDLRRTLLHRLLGGIAGSEFDAETDDYLGVVFEQGLALARPLEAHDPEFADSVAGYVRDERHREQQRRTAAEALRRLGLLSAAGILDLERRLAEQKDYASLPFLGLDEQGTRLLGLVALRTRDEDGGEPRPTWAGVEIDLGRLCTDRILGLERRLSSRTPYRVELLDEADRPVPVEGTTTIEEDGRDLARTLESRRRLGGRLDGFTLVAMPADPQALVAAQEREHWVRLSALLALVVTAFGAAFLFLRTVRRERELAELEKNFVARVSHELKTPLALIRMYGETIATGRAREPEKAQAFAGIIAKESQRLTRMIDNILDFAQIDAGTKRYEARPTRIDDQVEGLLASYGPQLEAEGFTLDVGPMDPAVAEVDPEALTQCLVNLLSNARKYTPDDGERRLGVAVRVEPPEVRVEVTDRGVGVPEAERERIFDTFYRASTSAEKRGAGLGLALVRHFAESHGGGVECLPRPGGGSLFRLRLPLAGGTDPDTGARSPHAPGG
ncbi:MAG: HAMP domain-containing sensor histidine kinase [Planctomycetota bacterium]